jgi:hypothetical protein
MRYWTDFIHKLHRSRVYVLMYNMVILVDLFFLTILGVGRMFLDLDLVNLVSWLLGLLSQSLAEHFEFLRFLVRFLELLPLAVISEGVHFNASVVVPTARRSVDCGPCNLHRSSAILANRLVRSLLWSSSINS